MKVYIKDRKRRKEEFQFFMHDFVDCCKGYGLETVPDILPSFKYHIRSVLKRIELFVYKYVRSKLKERKKALIVTANGGTIAENFFPYYYSYELIPMLWDVWPSTWLAMQRDFQRFGVKMVLVTSRSVANMINEEMPSVKALWVPEGIDISHYHKGDVLANRPYNVLEMGRQMKRYHQVLHNMRQKGCLNEWTTSIINPDGTLNQGNLTFTDNETLYAELPKYRVMVCFPQCDTNPFRGGNVETLTQRYWEAMLSGCLIIGRAPQELIDLIGYNPVIDVDWKDPQGQLISILGNAMSYQGLVDKNYQSACEYASWDGRIESIKEFLIENGYEV